MDIDIFFLKKLITTYNLDKILTPINLENGELENVSISNLRKNLDFCFIDIESYTLKEKLIEYLEDYLLKLGNKITSQKNKLKIIKRTIKKLEKQHPNLDINNNEDEIIIERINNHRWKLDQEKYILDYICEQPFFIRDWTSEKRKELIEGPLKELVEKELHRKETNRLINSILSKNENIIIPKKHIWHILIPCLINGDIGNIQGKAKKELTGKELSEILIKDFELNIEAEVIRPYIQATFINPIKDDQKNLYSEGKTKAIFKYCKYYKLSIEDEQLSRKIIQYNIE